MGEKFEIEISVESIDISKVLSCFKEQDLCRIFSIDNWNYENETEILSDCDLNFILDTGKIVQVYSENLRNGIFFEKEKHNYICSLFFECTDDFSDKTILSYKDQVSDLVIKHFAQYGILYAAFGCEMLISEDKELFAKISNSHNVYMWLTSDKFFPLPGYEYIKKDSYTLFIKKEGQTK